MKPIETVAIVGAGNMGSGIAQKTAQEQFPVQMVDREQQWVDRGQETIAKLLGEAVERRIFSEAQIEEIQSRIKRVACSLDRPRWSRMKGRSEIISPLIWAPIAEP